jgi:xylulokinase
MDPGMRYLWWQDHDPQAMTQAKHFIGWHEFLALRMTGRPVVDRSLAGRWLAYDLERQGWAPDRAADFGVDPALLPEIQPWGTVIGMLKPAILESWGLTAGVRLAVGALDLTCAAVGAGALDLRTACMVSGSFENLLIPCEILPTPRLLARGLSCTPYPIPSGLSVLALSPTGTAVLNWVRNILGVSIESLDEALTASGPGPSPLLAVPYLSGAMLHWQDGRNAKGALLGLTLASSRIDIIKAFMESVSYEHVMTLELLSSMGEDVRHLRAAGGGVRSTWWTQLKADILGVPIEVVDEAEPGTLGAAMLAGLAAGCFPSLPEGHRQLSISRGRLFTPDPGRAEFHRVRATELQETMTSLLQSVYRAEAGF